MQAANLQNSPSVLRKQARPLPESCNTPATNGEPPATIERPVRPLDTRQAALYLGLSWNTLNSWRYRGDGPRYLKLGAAVRYRVEDLDAFLMNSERTHTSQALA